MASHPWTENFSQWERGAYRDCSAVHRRRADGLNIRVLRHLPPVPSPESIGGWPRARSWLVSFWRLHDSQSFHLTGPDAAQLADVLGMEGISVATALVELNKRVGLLAWPAVLPGFAWTGELEDGATPPQRAPEDWRERLAAAGWTLLTVEDTPMAEYREAGLVIRVGVDPADEGAPYVPQCWFLEFATLGHRPLRRFFGADPALVPAGELYVTPWRDAGMVLEHLVDLAAAPVMPGRAPTSVDAIRSWLQASTDSAVEFVAPSPG
ncbi:hypothetical protein [Raineyella fluvialis]|uniref:Uncharacterized protein n=1 Tax=Raineyella fluvialis TaxID=2662261 RepID=A0A5Q2FDS6_9ACTN|nr:hypothetical protein [Raineyella fluvialis]QGF24521.1 hypothetical protein Rai3103_13645 [Raineyella fluvialis]